MSTALQRANRVAEQIRQLAAVSEQPGCIARTYGSTAFIAGRDLVASWMKEAGLTVYTDAIGNLRGRLSAPDPNAKIFVIGSHIDTVINAGAFDGPLGVLAGLEVLRKLQHQSLPFHLELVAFCDEEGCRFHTTYLGSKALTGNLDKQLLQLKDEQGISLQDAILAQGGDANTLAAAALKPGSLLGYYEIHIEQGPVLFEKNTPVAIVTAIAGQRRCTVRFSGEAGHAGTVPMLMRKDALAAASEFILAAEKTGRDQHQQLVVTIGKISIPHAASNVIPGEVLLTLDVRSDQEAVLEEACKQLHLLAFQLCEQRAVSMEWNVIQTSAPVQCDATLNSLLTDSVEKCGYEPIRLISGAGHDAVPLSAMGPVSMLFVKCYKGISHNPQENVATEDIAAAIEVSDTFIQQLIKKNSI